MTWRTIMRQSVPAGSSRQLRAVVRDEAGGLLAASELESVAVTLTDEASGATINGRDQQDILGANGGAVSAFGRLTLWLGPVDTAIQDAANDREVRVATLEWAYGGGKVGKHEVVFAVVRVA